MPKVQKNLQRDTLRKISSKHKGYQLAQLKLAYSEDSKLLTGYVNQLVNVNRIYPRHLPTQASFRWSTVDPPITNWPRACCNQQCQATLRMQEQYRDQLTYVEHEWTEQCWSVRDILMADDDEVLVTWDHDNIEGRIHDLIVDDKQAIKAHKEGMDLHTITCCNIFGYTLPSDLKNPHTSEADILWRNQHRWQGKDTKQRVLAKNFNHGSKYTKTHKFVHKIQGVEQYGISRGQLEELAKVYIKSKGDAWQSKLDIMSRIRRQRISRTLYGARRVFYDSSEETEREGFSHMISGTVSHYNDETLILLCDRLGDNNIILLHNAHDGDKIAVKKQYIESWYSDIEEFKDSIKPLIERDIAYEGRVLTLTAGVKVYV